MEGFRFVMPITVRFSDCDPLGHVNNAVFFTYLEEARIGWFRAVFGEGSARQTAILAEACCSFRSQVHPWDELAVGVRVERIGRSSFDHGYRIEDKGTSRLVAEARTVSVGFDYQKNVSRALSDDFRSAVNAYQGELVSGTHRKV